MLKRDNIKLLNCESLFILLSYFCLLLAVGTLLTLIFDIALDAMPRLNTQFLQALPSRFPQLAGIRPAIYGTIYVVGLSGLIAFPIGVGAAVYLEEYAAKNRFTRLIEINIANLAGVPSIIFGILGLQLFVRGGGLESLALGRTIAAGALTLALLILPIVIIAAREAIRAVPQSIRDGARALGATRWQVVSAQVLPAAFPSILTGLILALSRVIGETAPLVTMGALMYVPFVPDGLFSEFTVLPIQAFNWLSRPQAAFSSNAAAAICIMLVVLLLFNALAVYLRAKFEKRIH